ncbi:MAG: hypothetical protein U0841_30975 [Chloroflexia bacterium]
MVWPRGNTCAANREAGLVTGEAAPTLEGNACRENTLMGILYQASGRRGAQHLRG